MQRKRSAREAFSGDLARRNVLGAGLGIAGAGLLAGQAQAIPDPVAFSPAGSPLSASDPTAPLTLELAQGAVIGQWVEGVRRFLGVRYGELPAGRRFLRALPVRPSATPLLAERFAPACPQRKIAEDTAEDCLGLNIWAPVPPAGRRRSAAMPVLVYVHGGAFSSGSGAATETDGAALARHGQVVVITLNHRLNVFGHLFLGKLFGPDYAASGNMGLLDLVDALQWVQANISAFGGDRDNVTVFGQSGGGAKLATLMAMPQAAGLFHKVWTMSGQQVTAQGPRAAMARTRLILSHLGIEPGRAERLQDVPLADWLSCLSLKDPTSGGGLYFGPVLDEVSLPRHPFWPDAPAQSARIPMVLGNTREETAGLIAGGDPSVWALTWDSLPAKLAPAMVSDLDVDLVIATYRALYPQLDPAQVFIRATSAGRSWRGQVLEAQVRAEQRAPTWVYQLNWASPREGGRWGAYHTLDIPLVFLNTHRAGEQTGDDGRARAMAQTMADSLIRFARTGSPGGGDLGRWPQYDLARRATMVFDTASRVENDPRGVERRLFGKVPYLQPGTI